MNRSVLGSYANRANQHSYREIHSSRSRVSTTVSKRDSKCFSRHTNGIHVGGVNDNNKGLLLFYNGLAVLNIKSNYPNPNRETLYCFQNMSYCYQVMSELGYGTVMFYKHGRYLTLYTTKNNRQEGLQLSYDYTRKTMTKSLYKGNHLVRIIQSRSVQPHEAESTGEMREMFAKLSNFDFEVKGIQKVTISERMTYFGETKNDLPWGHGIILSVDQRYIGCFSEGLLEGFGSIYFPNQEVCEGLFSSGQVQRCCKYVRPVGVVYSVQGQTSSEQQYREVVQEYFDRFTVDARQCLKSPAGSILIELKDSLDFIQNKIIRRLANIRKKSVSSSLSQQQDHSPQSPKPTTRYHGQFFEPSKQIPQVQPLSSKYQQTSSIKNRQFQINKQELSEMAASKDFLAVGNHMTESIVKRQLPNGSASNLPFPYSMPKLVPVDFFESITIQQVHKDSVAEEFNKNIPKCMDVRAKDQRRLAIPLEFAKDVDQRNLIGTYIMEMIKQNTKNQLNTSDKVVKVITDRIRKSRIFAKEGVQSSKPTFTF